MAEAEACGNAALALDGEAATETAQGSLEGILDPDTLAAVNRVKELEERHWAVGLDVTLCNGAGVGLDSRKGRTQSFDASSRTFQVEVDGAEVLSVPLADLRFDFEKAAGPEGSVSGAIDPEAARKAAEAAEAAALEAARKLFVPGSLFEGTIAIPGATDHLGSGDEGDEPHEYKLEVISESIDELGQWSLLVRHAAYDDEQACYADFTVATPASPSSPPQVRVSYTDCETCCEGILDVDASGRCVLRGCVRQYVQGEEGFYEPSKEDTHVFELIRVTSCEAEARHGHSLEVAREQRVDALCAWIQGSSRDRDGYASRLQSIQGVKLPWKQIVLTDGMRLWQAQCAKLRRQSGILKAVVFKDTEAKAAKLASLRAAGLNRAAAHAANDAAMLCLKTLVTASMQTLQLKELSTACFKAHARLATSYAAFDLSMRTAEARLPQSLLHGWLCSRQGEGAPADDATCAVCFLALQASGDSEESAQLPCGHYFHFSCVSQWLHSHTTCPTCRHELAQEAEARDVGDARGGGSARQDGSGRLSGHRPGSLVCPDADVFDMTGSSASGSSPSARG